MSIKVAITDDHPLIIKGVKDVINANPQFELCGVYSSGADLLNGLLQQVPDVLLLDIQLPDKMGNELSRIVNKRYPQIAILALTNMDTIYYLKEMLQHGCMGYLTKHTDEAILTQAIMQVYNGEQFIEDGLKEQLADSILQKRNQLKSPQLTQREKEILQLIAREYTNQQIADKLFIALRTVENHRLSISQKLNSKNTAGLIKTALRMGLIEP
ncbi:MAG: response regulator transcription factor [Bacteroidetes bacterium]|nr:response regulator transcription factor [Bacteroidota bacterium]